MTGLYDLSNELLALVVTHITKPSDKLHFALLNKHYHDRIVPLLYKNITIDFTNYRIPQLGKHTGLAPNVKSPRFLVPQPPCSNFVRLAETTNGTVPHHIKSLTLKLQANNEANVIETTLCILLLLLPHLTQLRFALFECGRNGQPEMFSLAPFAQLLAPLSGTLRTLSIYLASKKVSKCVSNFYPGCVDGWTVGSLRHFSALEDLSIQMGSLLGREADDISFAD